MFGVENILDLELRIKACGFHNILPLETQMSFPSYPLVP